MALIEKFCKFDAETIACATDDCMFNPPGAPPMPIGMVLDLMNGSKAAFPEWKSVTHGVTKNEDGTYSRTYDAQAEGAAADANATAAAPKKPKRSFSINDIGKKEENITKSDLQLRAEKVFPALLNAPWRLYTRIFVALLLLYLLVRRYRPPRPRV